MSNAALAALKFALRAEIVNVMNFTGLIEIGEAQSRDWASVTFTGQQHQFCLCLNGPTAAETANALLADMADREFDLGRHILVDIALVADERCDGGGRVRLILEALTVEAD